MPEKDIERVLTKRIKDLNGIAYKFVSPNRRSVPDRLCLLPGGRVLFIEVKAPGKKPTKLQDLEHRKLRSLGFEVLVIDNKEDINAIT
jgi:hypothetical protein